MTELAGLAALSSSLQYPKGALLYRDKPCIVRSARQTARTANVRAVLRHFVPNKGLHPLRRYAAIPAALPSSAKTGVIYGQALGKPVESRNLRFELLHLPLPDVMLEALKRLKSVCPILLHNIELKKFLRCHYDF